MRYRPDWRKIIVVAVLFHVLIFSALSLMICFPTKSVDVEENIMEIEWIEEAVEENSIVPVKQTNEYFAPIKMPPLPEPTIEEKVEPPKPVESPRTELKKSVEVKTEDEGEEKPVQQEDFRGNVTVLVKVFPKDIFEQLISAGNLKERPILKSGKVVIAVTVGLDGIASNIEIRSGGGSDEMGNMIDIVSKAAASAWLFAPFKDENGNPKIIKTQIEFKPEDF